ncbi:MAG: T9SS type A sorting domain-containing protein [Hallella sp.]|nr:T9SS type A sorting domain-containing protein [Hallella sp.]
MASFVGQTAHAQKEQPVAAWTGTKPSDAHEKTVYLYNVGTKQFLGKGGRWGTEATMNVEGTPFTLTYGSGTFTLTSKVKQEGGDSNGKLTLMDGTDLTSKFDKFNYFVDGNVRASENHTITATGTPTEGYTLSITSTSSTPGTGNKSSMAGKTFYMFAEGANAHVSARLETATETMLGIRSDSTAYSKWIIVTEDQRKAAFQTVNDAHVAAVNATFLILMSDFARNDNSCEEWKTGATSTENPTGTLSYKGNKVCKPTDAIPLTITEYTYTCEHKYFGSLKHTSEIVTKEDHGPTWERECQKCLENFKSKTKVTYKKTNTKQEVVAGYTYYLGNGYDEGYYTTDPITGETMTVGENRQQSYGGAWTANIHGARGSVVQTIPATNMIKEGWYRISCVGFTTTTNGIARLFAASGKGNNTTGSGATAQSEKFAIANLHRIDAATRPATYVAASKLLDTPNVNTFDASVKVYVSPTNEAETPYETLSFGIQVGSAADPTQDADADAWTCFDNFKIEYLGTPPNDLILDEEQTDGGYIKAQAQDDDKTLQKSIVYLHRTMNPNKWNSLVLPISLTVGQVKSIFGDQVHISKFVGAKEDHPQRIVFDPITADRNDPDAIAIEAGKLYLVKPTADGGMPQEQTEKTFNKDGYNISVTDYYTIVGVTFKKKSEIADNAYSGRVMGDTVSEEYGTAQQVQFVGTYVKCFDTNLIPANSYVLNGNNQGGTAGLWYYRTVETKTKGFRGWLQSANGQASKGIEYEINGVVDQVNGDVTAIEGIEAAQQHNANIYNLNGQLVRQGATSTEGLPSGLYIVGGKKVVVK